jgi:hypothetical protein
MTIFGGGGFGSTDPNVQNKLAALKAKKHNDPNSGLKNFLERDLGVDMRQLPFNLNDATAFLHKLCQEEGVNGLLIQGNSMGLKQLTLDAPQGVIPCPQCGGNNGWWNLMPTVWFCEDCEENNGNGAVTVPADKLPTGSVLTDDQPGKADWHDVKRTFEALKKHIKFKRDSDADPIPTYSWRVNNGWREATVEPVEPKHVNPDPKSYPIGTILRIEQHILGETGAVESRPEYVRVGGLFNDDDIVILATMQPIEDLTGWTVVEELS